MAATPIHQLPNEILSEIFYGSCPSSGTDSHSLAPLYITQVCSRWRNLAVHLPSLWTRINIDDDADSQGQCLLTNLFLLRSSPQPLDVSITVSCPNLSRLVFQHSARFRSCHLLLTPEHPGPQSTLLVIKDNIPLLEELAFDWDIIGVSKDPPPDPNDTSNNRKCVRRTCWLGNMPKLQCLKLYSLDCYISRVGFPWSQIRHLTLTGSWSSNIDEALYLCPNLESVHFDYISDHDDNTWMRDETAFTCASLSKLSVNASYGRAGILPRYAVLPSLKELEFGGPGEEDTDSKAMVEDIRALVKRSSCRLESLTITGKGMPSVDLTTLLSYIPSLTSLSLSNYYGTECTDITGEFLQRLIQPCGAGANAVVSPSSPRPLLPNLVRLKLKHRPGAPVNVDLILHVLESRRYTFPHRIPAAGTTEAPSFENRLLCRPDSPQTTEIIALLRYADLGNLYGLVLEDSLGIFPRMQRLQADGLEMRYMVPG